MQAQASTSIVGLKGNFMQTPDQQVKPTPQQRAAARNELDRYSAMNWGDELDSHAELQDASLWVSDANNPTQQQEDIVMLLAAKQTMNNSLAAGNGE